MKYGLLGYQIAYSLSPLIHKMIGEKDIHYKIIDLAPAEFSKKLKKAVSGLNGFNVTIPYKESILSFCDAIDPTAKKIGAVNTIDIEEGIWTGYNTDYLGFISTVKENIPDHLSYFPVIVGYGGVAKAVAFGLERLGYPSISVYGGISAGERKAYIASLRDHLAMTITEDPPEGKILWINATPVGAAKIPDIPKDYLPVKKGDFLYDLNYAPCPTYLERQIRQRGNQTLNGLKMLLCQAAEAQKIWTKNALFSIKDPDSIIRSIAKLNNVS